MMTRAEFVPPSPLVYLIHEEDGWHLYQLATFPPFHVSGPHSKSEAERLLAVERLARGQDE